MHEGLVYWNIKSLCSFLVEQAKTSTWPVQTLTVLDPDSTNTSHKKKKKPQITVAQFSSWGFRPFLSQRC